MEPTVTITIKEYDSLKRHSVELQRLLANGVDNWEGYSMGRVEEDEE